MARPKGSKNKPKNASPVIVAEKRPRGRPRKTPLVAVTTKHETSKHIDRADAELNDLPEIESDDYSESLNTFSHRSYINDDWGNTGLDCFSIGIDGSY